jgi:hypothetical protein
MSTADELASLEAFLKRIPAVRGSIGTGHEDRLWWAKFTIDIHHRLAWHTVQELGCILNYLSIDERLPTVFMPVSPAPYLNGGPEDFLSWVIESKSPDFTPAHAVEWLSGRLPRPVEDESAWMDDAEA